MKKKLHILVAAGGTGGHLFPALAVVEQLEKLTKNDINISFIGSPDRIESKVIPSLGYNFYSISIAGLTKLLSLKTLTLPLKIFRAVLKSRSIIKRNKIDAVIATGAYLSYPPGVAAKQEKIPLFLMESNVNPGKAIKMLSGRADLIFTSFEESKSYFDDSLADKLRPVGNPVRGFILKGADRKKAEADFGLDPKKETILIFGGSLGANSINAAVKQELEYFEDKGYQVLWQTGKNYEIPANLPANVKALEFIDDMASAYAAADLVVSRSGATTVAELCVAGKASVLVPYPSASNKEQEKNAIVLKDAGAALLVPDSEIGDRLRESIESLMEDPKVLTKMGKAAEKLGRPDAAKTAAKEILEKLITNYESRITN